ncbi:MAG: hypothetical protein IJL02_10140 [Methanobrevibacter sp.]|uniref:hypothetical protein n=1 Tax=Methanobrevibacter sp. TaxID=66852 RepID=UPI0025ED2194|nr:hypothetical protein [Methanobrevibacter sp.]MBQ6100202.1 hypothetical protein [Methanobrevibacter sp.]
MHQNMNLTDSFGCCSIVWQLDGNETIMSYRRDSDLDADVFIKQVDWHGKQAIKQYKTDGEYFCHVIVTDAGWVIGLGGTDDGIDNEIAENITAEMINDNYTISEESLAKIQEIKKPYGKGHVVIKAPNGNYGFATVDALKTGQLYPGRYISIPNDYSYSRANDISLDNDDNIKVMNELSQSDRYGLDRREIITYDINIGENNNTTDVYVSNEDGSLVGVDNSIYIDNVYFNDNLTNGEDIPLAPDYKKLGSVSFSNNYNPFSKLIYWIIIISFVVFVGVLSFTTYQLIRFIKFKIRDKK